jgi:hypothetical protein
LEETVLGCDYSLDEEQIVLILCVDVSNSPAIAQNVDGLPESFYTQLTRDDRQSLMGGPGEIRLLAGLRECAKQKQKDQ